MNVGKNSSGLAVEGIMKTGKLTKRLLRSIRPRQIAVLSHEDLDEVAAVSLIAADVLAVVNAKRTMTGKFPLNGPLLLLQAKVPVFEIAEGCFDSLKDEEYAYIDDRFVYTKDGRIPCRKFTENDWQRLNKLAEKNVGKLLDEFIDNTLAFAAKEKSLATETLPLPRMKTKIAGRDALIVVRGIGYENDLRALESFILINRPVMIGVDGGADAILNCGYLPDLIVGDMDSVSDDALKIGAELIVHAYPDGRAPGLARIRALGLHAELIPAPGTSEDIAMLIAFECRANRIVAVGAHSHMSEFLQKGRKGMASTLLARMKIGEKLIDAKGIGQLAIGDAREGEKQNGHKGGAEESGNQGAFYRGIRRVTAVFALFGMLAIGMLIGLTFTQLQAALAGKQLPWMQSEQTDLTLQERLLEIQFNRCARVGPKDEDGLTKRIDKITKGEPYDFFSVYRCTGKK